MKRASFIEIISELPFLTSYQIRDILDIIDELYPNLDRNRKPVPPLNREEYEAKRMKRLTDILERLTKHA